MADTIVRAAVIRVNSRRVGKAEEAEFNMTAGDREIIGLDGVEGFSDGVVKTKLTIKTFEAVDGRAPDLTTAMLNKTPTKVSFFFGGKDWTIPNGRVTDATINSVSESGEVKGNFVIQGGKPVVA